MAYNIKIDIINLEHRRDRLDQVNLSMKQILDLKQSEFNIFKAAFIPENGMLGCALSHFSLLSDFIKNTSYDYQIIFEDDIVFRKDFKLNELVDELNIHAPNFDLFQFASWKHVVLNNLGGRIVRICNSVTTSGYLVKRDFAPKLLECFARSINLLKTYHSENPYQIQFMIENFAIDQIWKDIQLTHQFVTTNPTCGYQSEGYSDIHKKNINFLI